MDRAKIKAKLYKVIDSIQDDQLLQVVYDVVVPYATMHTEEITDELSDDQKKRLEQSLEQAKNGALQSHDQMKQEILKWSMK